MNTQPLSPALDDSALLAKSKVYIARALRCKTSNDLDEYQLWASLALELLGKTCLARIHPSLVVNPQDHISLFAAAGISIGTDIKTIASHTLFERLKHVVRGFDESVKKFCDEISLRRNSELHSGELPFREMRLEAWEGRYWHACQLILYKLESSLDDWIGANEAEAPLKLLEHTRQALADAAIVRTERAREEFGKRKKGEREQAIAASKAQRAYFFVSGPHEGDADWPMKCPACTARAYMTGSLQEEIVLEERDDFEDDGYVHSEETVEKYYTAEEFFCPTCGLQLDGEIEIEAAGMSTEFTRTETRERRYEEEYDNE